MRDQKECILHLAMQPDDAREPAKHLTLTALSQHGRLFEVRLCTVDGDDRSRVHTTSLAFVPGCE